MIYLQVPAKSSIENELDDRIRDFFKAVAGEDLEVDWMELKNILDVAINKGEFYEKKCLKAYYFINSTNQTCRGARLGLPIYQRQVDFQRKFAAA